MFEFVLHRRRRRHHFRQLFRTGHGLDTVTLNDGARDALTEALFAKGFNHPGDIRFVCRLQPLGGRLAASGVHTHIQRTIAHKREATLGIIKLR